MNTQECRCYRLPPPPPYVRPDWPGISKSTGIPVAELERRVKVMPREEFIDWVVANAAPLRDAWKAPA